MDKRWDLQFSRPAKPRSRRQFLGLVSMSLGTAVLLACEKSSSGTPAGETATPVEPTPSGSPPASPSTAPTSTATPASPLATYRFIGSARARQEGQLLRVDSDGMPDHLMMVGIRSWQQQVPLPQPYSGANAWTVPLQPRLADRPISAKTALYRGAIALAANGVPIFNALNNRGDDAFLAGELDQWGGHSGRADDYHYHMAPLHLQQALGKAAPLAWGLDGYPLYGLEEPDGSPVRGLDEFNGHADAAGHYHYHATLTYPYINGGMRGVVQVRDDQVDPQPAAAPVRPFLQPLRDATITAFAVNAPGSYSLSYEIRGAVYRVNYGFQGTTYTFEFVDPSGNRRVETYERRMVRT